MVNKTLSDKNDCLAVYAHGNQDKAQAIAHALHSPLLTEWPQSGYRFILQVNDQGLALHRRATNFEKPIIIKFQKSKNKSGKHDPLIRSMGKEARTVIDATAGYGADSVLLASHGFQVMAIERSALVYTMLKDALENLHASDLNIMVICDDSIQLLPLLQSRPDVIYLDPMYPPRRKTSALPRKEIMILRELVGSDIDAGELYSVARRTARQRVVVKRPPDAPPLAADPSFCIESKLLRFDVYLIV